MITLRFDNVFHNDCVVMYRGFFTCILMMEEVKSCCIFVSFWYASMVCYNVHVPFNEAHPFFRLQLFSFQTFHFIAKYLIHLLATYPVIDIVLILFDAPIFPCISYIYGFHALITNIVHQRNDCGIQAMESMKETTGLVRHFSTKSHFFGFLNLVFL